MMSLTLQTEFHHILFLLDMSQLPTNSVNLQWIDRCGAEGRKEGSSRISSREPALPWRIRRAPLKS